MFNRIVEHCSEPVLSPTAPLLSGNARQDSIHTTKKQRRLSKKRASAGKKIQRVIVPLDGSRFAEHAIPVALELAEKSDASLQLLHVAVAKDLIPPMGKLCISDSAFQSHVWQKHQYLCDIVGLLRWSTKTLVSSKVARSHNFVQHLQASCDPNTDLIVMATHGRGFFSRLFRKSLSHALLRHTQATLVLVPEKDEEVLLKARRIDHLMLAVDDPRKAQNALKAILDIAPSREVSHTLLRVVQVRLGEIVRQCFTRGQQTAPPRWWIEAVADLYPLACTLRRRERRVHSKVIRSEARVGKVVLDCAKQTNTDLIVVPFQSRPFMNRILQPSTADYLFRASDTPVMFVSADDCRIADR